MAGPPPIRHRLARVTYSIVAADTASGEIGSAVASCVPLETVLRVPGEVSARGAYVTQSYLLDAAHGRARAAFLDGGGAEAVVAALVDPDFDAKLQSRQYAAVDLDGGVAAFTGSDTLAFASHRTAREGSLVFSVQGNILTDGGVLSRMETAFRAGGACDLAERLVRALEAARTDGGGDSRCTSNGTPSSSAVVRARDLVIEVPEGSGDPTVTVRARFDAWRKTHPCTTPKPRSEDEGCAQSSHCGAPATLLVVASLLVLALVFRRRVAR